MPRNTRNNKNGKVAKNCHQFSECGDSGNSGSFGKVLSKLPNSEKLIMVAILSDLRFSQILTLLCRYLKWVSTLDIKISCKESFCKTSYVKHSLTAVCFKMNAILKKLHSRPNVSVLLSLVFIRGEAFFSFLPRQTRCLAQWLLR